MEYNQLRIVISGSRCNLRCAYCLAGYSDRRTVEEYEIDEEKMLELIQPHTFSSISIWGGEPFYNFAKLKAVVEFCARHQSGLPILIISNGTALSKDYIDFIKKYDLKITLSHDGLNQHYRGRDFLKDENALALVREMDDVGFSSVIHKYNCDFEKIFRYFENIRDQLKQDFFWGFELLQPEGPTAVHFLPGQAEIQQFSWSLDFLLDQFVQGHPFAYTSLHTVLNKMATMIDNRTNAGCRCGATNRLSITTKGERAFCQVMAEQGRFEYPSHKLPNMCEACDVSSFCRGYCPSMSDNARKQICTFYKTYYAKLNNFLVSLRSKRIASS